MKSLIFLILVLMFIIFIFPKKEKFNYIGIGKYHNDSFKLGLHGKRKNHFKLSNYIPLVNYFLL